MAPVLRASDIARGMSGQEVEKLLRSLPPEELLKLPYQWEFWAREEQLPPAAAPDGNPWDVWAILAGRGFGKTRSGAEWIRARWKAGANIMALVAPTEADYRDVMINGPAGLKSISPSHEIPRYIKSDRKVIWPNGAYALCYSSEEPDRLRGPQFEFAWCDELAAWKNPNDTWDMLMMTMRLGPHPQVMITTTPRPIDIIKKMVRDPRVAITKGETYDNAPNMPKTWLELLRRKYEGTRLGRQELQAHILDDNPDALWNHEQLDRLRIKRSALPEMRRIIVAIDPPVTSGDNADECGMIVAGVDAKNHGYVIEDITTYRDRPSDWATRAVEAWRTYDADCIIAEVNQGGDMVEATIRQINPNVPYRAVRATRGKVTRAEPVSALYEQGRVHHVGVFARLEDQMCEFTSDFDRKVMNYSPDRVDALVWAFFDLIVEHQEGFGFLELARRETEAARSLARPGAIKREMLLAPGSVEWLKALQGR